MTGRTFFRNAAVLLTIGAVLDQARRPPNERTWHGRFAGVPYDFRLPSPDRVTGKLWNPENPSLCAPTLWGVGWTINLYHLAHPFES